VKGTSAVLRSRLHCAAFVFMLLFGGLFGATTLRAAASPAGQGIYVIWPEGWQMQPLSQKGSALSVHARQIGASGVIQLLQITAVPADASPHPVTPATLRQTVEKLRDSVAPTAAETRIELQPFHRLQGFYFTMTDKHPTGQPNDYPQMIEGVFLSSGYLINVTLLTRNAKSTESVAMVDALETIVVK
jgi:hypothetical protein